MEATSLPLLPAHIAMQNATANAQRVNNGPSIHLVQSQDMSLEETAKLEMQSFPTKTPVSILQELLTRRSITPKYELVQIDCDIYGFIFRYKIFLSSEFVATSTGRTKKEAKQAAAKNFLDLLVGKQAPEQAKATNDVATVGDIRIQVVSSYDDKAMGNPIRRLQEICMSRRWPFPSYTIVHEEGMPHEREFTIACEVLKHKVVGTGKSKKLAKRIAAHYMLQNLLYIPTEVSYILKGSEKDDELTASVLTRYNDLKDNKTLTKTNFHNVSKFHKNFKQSLGAKLKELQNLRLNVEGFNFVQFLQEIALEQQFEVTYVDIKEKSVRGKYQCLMQLSTSPVTVCLGSGNTPIDAQTDAAHYGLEYLKIMTKK
ncbi:hypothetical protein FQR65_LT05355 [Abscondita terminalis]|nr:hypothetical protein FQR65_LT05355 [Abscondita terminalis]